MTPIIFGNTRAGINLLTIMDEIDNACIQRRTANLYKDFRSYLNGIGQSNLDTNLKIKLANLILVDLKNRVKNSKTLPTNVKTHLLNVMVGETRRFYETWK